MQTNVFQQADLVNSALHLLHVVSWKHPFSAPQAAEPPTGRICSKYGQNEGGQESSESWAEAGDAALQPCSSAAGLGATFREDLHDVVGVEAELVGVLGVVGVQSATLGDPGLRFGSWFGTTRSRKRLHLLGAAALQPAADRSF